MERWGHREPIVSPSFTVERAPFGLQVKEDGASLCGFVTSRGAYRCLLREVAWALRRGFQVEVNFAVQPDPRAAVSPKALKEAA